MKLFRIVQGRGGSSQPPKEEQPLALQLHYEYGDDIQYVALSYVWGSNESQQKIRIDGVNATIHRNLHDFLLLLRERKIESLLWADALCINQDDEEEKSREVNRMGQIYGKAAAVYHWLGPSRDDSDYLFDWLIPLGRKAFEVGMLDFVDKANQEQEAEILHFIRDTHPELIPEPDQPARDYFPEAFVRVLGDSTGDRLTWAFATSAPGVYHEAVPFLVQLALDNPEELSSLRSNMAMKQFLQREFFQRLWIIQELGLSRNNYFLCGNKEIPVDHFDSFLSIIDGRLSMWTISRVPPSSKSWMRGFSYYLLHPPGLQVRQTRRLGPSSMWPILEAGIMISDIPQLAAADPRDIIFGLLAVSDDKELLGLSADYSKSTAQVFSEAAGGFIQHCEGYPIGTSTFPKDQDDLPSWVPDWTRLGEKGYEYLPLSVLTLQRFCPFKGLSNVEHDDVTAPRVEGWATLVLYGFRVSSISSVMSFRSFPRPDDPEDQIQDSIDRIHTFCHENGVTDESALIRTCVLNNIAIYSMYTSCDDTYCKFAAMVILGETMIDEQQCSTEEAEMLAQYRFVDTLLHNDGPWQVPSLQSDFSYFAHHVRRNILSNLRAGNTLFVTEDRKVGMAPRHIMQDDFVAIVGGQYMPLVLRPTEDGHCNFVAEAYVDGIMDGEGMNDEAELEIFRVI
jgi:hypothetical protein